MSSEQISAKLVSTFANFEFAKLLQIFAIREFENIWIADFWKSVIKMPGPYNYLARYSGQILSYLDYPGKADFRL